MEEDDEGDDWGERRKKYHNASHSGDESDHSSGSRKRSHAEGKSERKLPRLNLDDALIMVCLLLLRLLEDVFISSWPRSKVGNRRTIRKRKKRNQQSNHQLRRKQLHLL